MKILIAEDDTDSRVYLERILKGNGFEVDSAENGKIALEKARKAPPDLIVSDILMPEMDGFALCLQWKNDEQLNHIPIVFYTATYTGSQDEQLAMSLGAARFVIKPQPPEALLQIIREVLTAEEPATEEAPDFAVGKNGVISQYNAALFRKLEKKIWELEQEAKKRKTLEQDILQDAEIARRVQQALLSPIEPNLHVEVTTIYNPLLYVGGDLYFLDWRHAGKLLRGFLIDAMGRGLSTALYAAAQHVMLRELNETDLPLAEQVRLLNRRIAHHFTAGNTTNGIAFEIDLETRELRWVNAGLSKFWIHSAIEHKQQSSQETPLGLHLEERFETHALPLSIGDAFYYCTDGLRIMLENRSCLPLKQYPEMVNLLQTLAESKECSTDATAICVQICSFPDSAIRREGWPKYFQINCFGDYQRFKGNIAQLIADVTGKPHSLQEVAVHEALANAMECRDAVARPHRVLLRFNKIGNKFFVRVKTTRMGFAGNAVLRRLRTHPQELFSYGEDSSMGRGIPMMLSLSHRMLYNADGTELFLAWNLMKT